MICVEFCLIMIYCFRPHRIVPTVNTSKDKVKQQLDVLRVATSVLKS